MTICPPAFDDAALCVTPPPEGEARPALGRPGGGRIALATAVFVAALGALPAFAQMTPVGAWKSIDDKTGEAKALMRISDQRGQLTGRIEKLLKPPPDDPNPVCDRCTDDRKNQPLVGLEIIRGAKKAEGKDVWEGGKVLDPEIGTTYTLRLTPIEGGSKLQVRGSFGPFGRTQTWVRVP